MRAGQVAGYEPASSSRRSSWFKLITVQSIPLLMQQSINLDRELNYLPYRLRYHSHSRRKTARTPTPAHRRAPSLNNRPQKSRPIVQNFHLEIHRGSEQERSCSSRSGQQFQEEECITTCQTDRVKPSQESQEDIVNKQENQRTNQWGVFGLEEMQDMKNMLFLDLAEEKAEEKLKSTILKPQNSEAFDEENDIKHDKQSFEESEIKTDFVKTTVLLQDHTLKNTSSSKNHFQSSIRPAESVQADEESENYLSLKEEIRRQMEKDHEMAQMREAISMKYILSKSKAENNVYQSEDKQGKHKIKVIETIESHQPQNLNFKSQDQTINELQKKLQLSGLFEQPKSKSNNIQSQQRIKGDYQLPSTKTNNVKFTQTNVLQSKMAELEAKINSIRIEANTASSIRPPQQKHHLNLSRNIRESPKKSELNVVKIQEGNYICKEEQSEIDDWKWVQPMSQRVKGNNIKYMRKPNSHYRQNIVQQKKQVVDVKISKKQQKHNLPPKKDRPQIKYQANLLNNNLKSLSKPTKKDYIKVENHQQQVSPIKEAVSMRPKSSIFNKNVKIQTEKDIIQLQQVKQTINTNLNQENCPNIQTKQVEKAQSIISPQHNLQIPLTQSPIKPRINFKKALVGTPQRYDLLLQSKESKISGCSSRQNSSGGIPSQSGQNLIYLMGSEHLKELSSLVMQQRNSQIESSDVLSQQLQRVLNDESIPQQISGYALSLDQSLSSSFKFQPQEQEQESTFNLQAALLEDSLLFPTLTSQTQSILPPQIVTFSEIRPGLTAKHKQFQTKNIDKIEESKELTFHSIEPAKFSKLSGPVETSRSKDTEKKSVFQSDRQTQRESKIGNMPKDKATAISKSGVSIGNKSIGRRDKSRMEKNLSRFKTRINS